MHSAELSPSIDVISPNDLMKYNNLWLFKDANDKRDEGMRARKPITMKPIRADETENERWKENARILLLFKIKTTTLGVLWQENEYHFFFYSMHLWIEQKRRRAQVENQMLHDDILLEWYFFVDLVLLALVLSFSLHTKHNVITAFSNFIDIFLSFAPKLHRQNKLCSFFELAILLANELKFLWCWRMSAKLNEEAVSVRVFLLECFRFCCL